MSNISTVYDGIISKIDNIFPGKQRLHNPYDFMDDAEITLKDAYGLKTGAATQEVIEYCNLSVSRAFSFVLVRSFATVGRKDDAFDAVTKSLLEDQQTFLNNFFSPTELGISNIIDQITFDSISGVEFVQTASKKYLFCEIVFKITLSESVI